MIHILATHHLMNISGNERVSWSQVKKSMLRHKKFQQSRARFIWKPRNVRVYVLVDPSYAVCTLTDRVLLRLVHKMTGTRLVSSAEQVEIDARGQLNRIEQNKQLLIFWSGFIPVTVLSLFKQRFGFGKKTLVTVFSVTRMESISDCCNYSRHWASLLSTHDNNCRIAIENVLRKCGKAVSVKHKNNQLHSDKRPHVFEYC